MPAEHGALLPDGRVLAMAGNTPCKFKDADMWARAFKPDAYGRAWHEAEQPTAGEALRNDPPMRPTGGRRGCGLVP
jgi:hypothetical protein